MEHRWGRRIPLDVGVRLACRPDAVGAGRLLDASLSGAFVQTTLDLPLYGAVLLDFEHGNRREPPRISGFVVRKSSDGFGLEWSEFAPEGIAELIVQQQAGDDAPRPLAARARP